ncbi:MAG: polysaccharide biosynthesis protein, partial [Anaerolineae bacterium]|nr:polysaccharide biosynthesis protein [Anaerolineae bacterium]
SELCRQLLYCGPSELLILGHGENSVFEIYHELNRIGLHGPKLTPLIADVRFGDRIMALFKQHRPQLIFHAAAHKHVPLMEQNPAEAITNNTLGTQNVVAAALAVNVERFVMISTDKAVNPTSVMGASKRSAELLVHRAARESKRPFVTVRFGNVLGSRGSVVLTFKKQIEMGGPITITHPDIERYFMTIPEAVQLVLQSSVLGQGGDIFVLDMGQQVRILDLAVDLIKLSGLEPERDIQIIYSGIRPGEKLAEELFLDQEAYRRTRHPKVFTTAYEGQVDWEGLRQTIAQLINLTRQVQTLPDREQAQLLLTKICHAVEQHQNGSISRKSDSAAPDSTYPRPLSARI